MRRSNCKSRVSRRNINICSRDKSVRDSPDCIPDGWTVEVKFRKSGSKEGAKYKCYIAPITGCKFYSKTDVARYLKSEIVSNHPPKVKERGADVTCEDNVVVLRKNLVKELPPGWVQEMKVRKTGDRRDPYYTHPGSEYIFRSKKDVFRYVELGVVGKHAIKRKKEDINSLKVAEECASPPSAAKRQKLKVRARGRRLFTEEGSSVNNSKDAQILESVAPKRDISLSLDAPDQCGECTDLSGFILLEHKDSEERQMKTDCPENKVALAPLLDNELAKKDCHENKVVLAPPLDNELSMCTIRKTQHPKRKNKKELTVPRRASERIAALRAVHLTKLDTSNQVSQGAAIQTLSLKADLPIDSIEVSQVHLEPEPEANLISHVSKVSNDGENIGECRYFLGTEEQSNRYGMGHYPREEQSIEFEKLDGNQVPSGTLEAGEKLNGKPESPLVLPFGDSWPDPCLEFAFKTLTGAIPVEENLIVEDLLKQQLNLDHTHRTSEFSQPGFVSDGIYQTDLFKFDSLVKPSDLPEMQWSPAIPTSGSDSKLNYGKNVLQWNGERKK